MIWSQKAETMAAGKAGKATVLPSSDLLTIFLAHDHAKKNIYFEKFCGRICQFFWGDTFVKIFERESMKTKLSSTPLSSINQSQT